MIEQDAVPATAPAEYVRSLFDQYAERFEADLQGRLAYQAPQLLRAAIEPLVEGRSGTLDILDIGCERVFAALRCGLSRGASTASTSRRAWSRKRRSGGFTTPLRWAM